ncbi:MAG: AGE family epimerase/isomerase [Bacteroidales bacterium]|jgi:N-acylglucosamine 2-epimerase|nr:AGE family epimerase/isomerase [Bacteroidales bacterium]
MSDLYSYVHLYRGELLDRVIPFWMSQSPDEKFGGYFTCLDRKGEVFDTDKFMWLQGRQVWFFSMIYNEIEKKQEWLDMALLGARFMQKYGMDESGNWYFSLTRDGKPLIQPYNIFSDCFAAMGFGELYKATGNDEYKKIALSTFQSIKKRSGNPKGIYNKTYPGTRPLKGFSLPMILCNLSLILEDVVGTSEVNDMVHPLIDEILNTFYQKDSGLILENVAPDGTFVDCFEGRCINPGHINESTWFMMDIAERYHNQELAGKSVEILLRSIEYGWDKQYGGIFYFKDIKNHPPQQLEWDQKLWWVHIETLIATLKGYRLTGNEQCLSWFLKLHEYTWEHFRDNDYPEWYGYLNRQGAPLLTLKGGKWKGCFHVPRGLYQIWKTLESIEKQGSEKHKEMSHIS